MVSDGKGIFHRHARVRCGTCEFKWFGTIAAHGLSVLGSCPLCGGQLDFRDHEPEPSDWARAAALERAGLQPWQVMGAPTSWAGH